MPGGQALQDAINGIAGKAQFDVPSLDVYVRVARENGAIYFDVRKVRTSASAFGGFCFVENLLCQW